MKLTERQKRALRKSILKWEAIAFEGGFDNGTGNCACCLQFYDGPPECKGCPVFQSTGQQFCEGSPYELWSDHHDEYDGMPGHVDGKVFDDRSRALAEAEYIFLIEILGEWCEVVEVAE